MRTFTGPELAVLNSTQLAQKAIEYAVFGQVTPQQTEQIVRVLREQGKTVGVVGDSPSDIPAMQRANLAIGQRSSSRAAQSVSDIVLLEDSPAVLSRVVDKGQRIVNGLLDVLKLYLTQVFYLILLVIVVPLFVGGFPYTSAQGGMVALVTLTIPAVGLSIWAGNGILPTNNLGRLLAVFVLPAAFSMAAVALNVYVILLQRTNDISYAQIGLSHTLVATGLLLVVFISPPIHLSWHTRPRRGDIRLTLLVMASALVFLAITYIPLSQEYLKMLPLERSIDYILVGIATIAWALGVQFLWAVIPLERRIRTRLLKK